MNRFGLTGLSRWITRLAWGMLLFTLPVTSFPFFPAGLGGKTLVRPLATYPLLILLFLVTLPRLLKRPLPKTFLPLLAFATVALISSLVALTFDVEALRGVTLEDRFLRNVVTLGLGIAFYATISLLPESWDDMRFSLRWLYAGFAVALFWGSLQALYLIHFSPAYFEWLNKLQGLISTRKLFTTRISGMTYEPKWFAEQICFLLLPWLLGSILSKRSAFRLLFKGLTVEWLLLAWAAIILVFTFSRSGLFILGLLGLLGFLIYRYSIRKKVVHPASAPKGRLRIAVEVSLIICSLVGAFFLVGSQNPYVSRFWRYFTEAKQRNRTYLEYIAVQQRLVYLATAFRIFEVNPVLGVGLGNYAFYFAEMIPNERYNSPELVRQITPVEGRDRLITPKNLFARLLAETGAAGILLFIAYLCAVLGCASYLWFSPSPLQRFWGLGGLLAMVVFSIVAFSFDSFALPNMWVIFGLLTAACHLPDPVEENSPAT